MLHGCTSQRVSNSAASPSSERPSLPLQRTRTGHKEWRRGRWEVVPMLGEGSSSFRSPARRWPRWFTHLLGGGVCRGHVLWVLQKRQLGVLVSLYLLSKICCNCTVIFGPIKFLCILSLQVLRAYFASRCKALQHCNKGSSAPALAHNLV